MSYITKENIAFSQRIEESIVWLDSIHEIADDWIRPATSGSVAPTEEKCLE